MYILWSWPQARGWVHGDSPLLSLPRGLKVGARRSTGLHSAWSCYGPPVPGRGAVHFLWGCCGACLGPMPGVGLLAAPGLSSAHCSLLLQASLSVPSTGCRQLQDMVWKHWPSVQNDNRRATTNEKVTARSLLWPYVRKDASVTQSFHSTCLAW